MIFIQVLTTLQCAIIFIIFLNFEFIYSSAIKDYEKCINRTQFNRIDALTTLQNGTILLIREPNYWILPSDQPPIIAASRPLETLLGKNFHLSEIKHMKNNETIDIQERYAVAHIRIQAQNGECLPANQMILYKTSIENDVPQSNQTRVIVFENDSHNVIDNIEQLDYLAAAKSIDWKKPVTAISYWNGMIIIFQGDHFVSVQCSNGKWLEIVSKPIREVFPGLPEYSVPDSVMVRETKFDTFSGSPIDRKSADLSQSSASGIVYLFYATEFYKCDVTGSDKCEGPYDLLSEFLNVANVCVVGCLPYSFGHQTAYAIILLAAGILIIYVLLCRPVKYQYLISAQHNAESNRQREENYYETLKFNPEYAILKSEQELETVVADKPDCNKNLSQ